MPILSSLMLKILFYWRDQSWASVIYIMIISVYITMLFLASGKKMSSQILHLEVYETISLNIILIGHSEGSRSLWWTERVIIVIFMWFFSEKNIAFAVPKHGPICGSVNFKDKVKVKVKKSIEEDRLIVQDDLSYDD